MKLTQNAHSRLDDSSGFTSSSSICKKAISTASSFASAAGRVKATATSLSSGKSVTNLSNAARSSARTSTSGALTVSFGTVATVERRFGTATFTCGCTGVTPVAARTPSSTVGDRSVSLLVCSRLRLKMPTLITRTAATATVANPQPKPQGRRGILLSTTRARTPGNNDAGTVSLAMARTPVSIAPKRFTCAS